MKQVTVQTTITRVPAVVPAPPVQLYQYGDDYQVLGGLRGCASIGCPAVMVLNDAPDTWFDVHWQMYLVASNFGMDPDATTALIGWRKALANTTGIGNPDSPRANWIGRGDLTAPNPRLDKLRTFALNTHSGTETYSLAFALANILRSARSRSFLQLRSAMAAIADTNALELQTMDGNLPPPMKPGARRPMRVEEIIPSDYEILPSDPRYRHLFLDCSNIKSQLGGDYKIGPFAHGLVRSWTGDSDMHSFVPLASTKARVLSPLANWKKIPLGDPFPSPFKRA